MIKSSQPAPAPRNRFVSFVSNCLGSMKQALIDCHAYAYEYDPYQAQQVACKSGYNPYAAPPMTEAMKGLIQEDATAFARFKTFSKNVIKTVTSSLVYGAFTFTDAIRTEKNHLDNYFNPKATFEEPITGDDEDYYFVERTDEVQFIMDLAYKSRREVRSRIDNSMDHTWGFVDDDLTVNYMNTAYNPRL